MVAFLFMFLVARSVFLFLKLSSGILGAINFTRNIVKTALSMSVLYHVLFVDAYGSYAFIDFLSGYIAV